jgi:hypothetical protein
LSTHTAFNTTSDFGGDAWTDFHCQQWWTADLSHMKSRVISDRFRGKPVVNLEYGYEDQDIVVNGWGWRIEKSSRKFPGQDRSG